MKIFLKIITLNLMQDRSFIVVLIIIFICSLIKEVTYGVEYFNEDDEFSNLITLPKEEYLNKLDVVDKELVKDIISIIAYDNKKIECLYDELFLQKRSYRLITPLI